MIYRINLFYFVLFMIFLLNLSSSSISFTSWRFLKREKLQTLKKGKKNFNTKGSPSIIRSYSFLLIRCNLTRNSFLNVTWNKFFVPIVSWIRSFKYSICFLTPSIRSFCLQICFKFWMKLFLFFIIWSNSFEIVAIITRSVINVCHLFNYTQFFRQYFIRQCQLIESIQFIDIKF